MFEVRMLTKEKQPSDKSFGIFFSILFFIIFIWFYDDNLNYPDYIFLVLSLSFLLTSLYKPVLLNNLKKLWLRLGLLIGKIFHPILLGVIYFFVISPISILLKICGRDELRLKVIRADTFWSDRENKKINPSTFKNQY